MENKILNSFKWDLLGKIINQSVGFVITIILSRLLMPEDFGLLALLVAFTSLVNGFVNFGFSSALIQKKTINITETSSVFFLNVFMGTVITVIFFFLSKFISEFYGDYRLNSLAKVFSLTFVINSTGLVSLALLEKEMRFKELMKIQTVSGMTSGVIGVTLALNDYGVWSLLIQSLINELLKALLALRISSFKPLFLFNYNALKPLGKYGFNLFLSGLLNSIFFRVDYLVMGKFFSPVLLGLFYRAKSFRTLIMRYTSDSLGKVFFPVFSKKQNDFSWMRKTILESLVIVSSLICFIATGLFVLSEEIFVILFSEKWVGAIPYFKILLLSSITFPIISIFSNVINGMGFSKKFLFTDIFEKIGILFGLIFAIYYKDFFIYLYIDLFVRYLNVFLFLYTVNKIISIEIKKIIFLLAFVSSVFLFSIFAISSVFSFFHDINIYFMFILKGVGVIIIFALAIFIENKFNNNSIYKIFFKTLIKRK
ncbi:lipopolysaccharide biosynthesis protein [uncultured Polaribacter sp.]|uniref:lipopolysaccharide biosynthesis protein n=1 Tax=uncultured Polaribacter sp. TaxID=174711 RepID=UPI00259AF90A|nr:lipopolysaccharide biosynthesis protein [uncultured Polaribacter sp.]